jgi:formylglycine-generating enzyme required for sulfatase activity
MTTPESGMVAIHGGRFRMGSDHHYPEEGPSRDVEVGDFWIDAVPVRNRDFAEFVRATGYVTLGERPPDPREFPGALPHLLVPGSAVFLMPRGPVDLRVVTWWHYVPDASWRAPEGPGSSWIDRPDHPVVHVALEDAVAYCQWARKTLPTEAEWEYAARGGLSGATYAWGDVVEPDGVPMANVWSGEFPVVNLKPRPPGTEPVGGYPPNGYGLFDVIGNVWEWTASIYSSQHSGSTGPRCCGSSPSDGAEAKRPEEAIIGMDLSGDFVLKGGSYLCARNYCRRYRPAARLRHPADSPAGHIGFRCVRRMKLD